MKKVLSLLLVVLISSALFGQTKTFFDFKVKGINGDSIDLSIYKGKKVLVVNTASYCGYTPQYEALQDIWELYGPDNFVIIGFPSNDFGAQEPGSDIDIKDFCETKYGVTFPMMSKITVKGANIHPVYNWLTKKSENGVVNAPVQWNFQKFMINKDGSLHGYKSSATNPKANSIVSWIEDGLSIHENQSKLNIYFSSGQMIIDNNGSDELQAICIYDLKGLIVFNRSISTVNPKPIPISNLNSGIYLLRIQTSHGVINRKVMIVD